MTEHQISQESLWSSTDVCQRFVKELQSEYISRRRNKHRHIIINGVGFVRVVTGIAIMLFPIPMFKMFRFRGSGA